MRLSSQVSSLVSRLPIFALYTRSRLSFLIQLIIALLIGSHLFLFSIIFIFFLPFFLRKTKTSLPLAPGEAAAEQQQRGMCRDYQSVIFFVSFFLLLSFLSIVFDHYQIRRADPTGSRLSIGKALDRGDCGQS